MFGERKKIESVQFQLLRHCVWAKVWAELAETQTRARDAGLTLVTAWLSVCRLRGCAAAVLAMRAHVQSVDV